MEFCDNCKKVFKERKQVVVYLFDKEICSCCQQRYSDHYFFLNKKCAIVDCAFNCRPPTVKLNSAVGWLYAT